jgi:undecaprenyl-diphosphatase
MELLKSAILGIIQGLTEFLPVSSSGHLVLAGHFFNFQQPGLTYEVALHFGSLIAVLIFFREHILRLIKSIIFFKNKEYKNERIQVFYLFVATFITAVIGLSFKDYFEALFSKPIFVPVFLSVTGLILFFTDNINSKDIKSEEMGILKAAIIGIGQGMAILPGISRSGTTIATGLYLGIKREDMASFSFLLSIPAILGAAVLQLKDITEISSDKLGIYAIGLVSAFISGYLVIAWLIKLIKNRKIRIFSFYCWAIAIVSITFLLLGY